MNVLPGQPTDGTGAICIHLFVPDENGIFVEPHALHPVLDDCGQQVKQQVVAKPTRGIIACDSRKNAKLIVRNGITVVTMRTDSVHAVTCPKCIESEHYKRMMDAYNKAVNGE